MNLQEVAVFTVNDVLKHARIMRDCQAACGEIAIRLFQMYGTKMPFDAMPCIGLEPTKC